MYNDGVITTEFTGYYDSVEQEYAYPSARQNFVIRFPLFYLSAEDGDFTDGGVTITTETGSTEDITIGNATAAVLSATMLNPYGLMDNLDWEEGAAYIGVVTDKAVADTYNSWPCHIEYSGTHYGIDASGTLHAGATTYAAGGEPYAVVKLSTVSAYYYTSTGAYFYNGSSFSTAQSNVFLEGKYSHLADPVGILLDSNLIPSVVNNIAENTKVTYSYVPMGVFDFSNVDAFGITFSAEAYDKMTLFDADATDWVKSLDFTAPKTLSQILAALMTEMGLSYTVSASAVNTSVSWDVNPITTYTVTYRQVLKWLAEAMGCNARMSRTGTVELYTFSGTSVATVTPDTIVSNTRTKTRYAVPQITKCVCYNCVGAGYESGVDGSPYYVVGNPFIDPSGADGLTPVTALKNLLDDIPSYYPTSISIGCADPRLDSGDFLTVQSTDGLSTYAVPVMRQTLHWASICTANILASGQQVRAIPNSMVDGTDLSGVVSSNPAAVVNMIEAHGINADWITAGLISDREHKNYWDLETGEFVITDGLIQTTFTVTYVAADYSQEDLDTIDEFWLSQIDLSDAEWEKYDINGDGYIDEEDYRRIEEMISTSQNIVKTITTIINPAFSDKAIAIEVTIPEIGTMPEWNATSYYSGGLAQSQTVKTQRIYLGRPDHATDNNGEVSDDVVITGWPWVRPDMGTDDTVSTSSGTWKTAMRCGLSPGVWLVSASARFDTNTTGRRQICISSTAATTNTEYNNGCFSTSDAVSSVPTSVNLCNVIEVNQPADLFMNIYQNSGSSLSAKCYLAVVRLV